MSQYSTGLSSVTNGSPTVTGTNTLWLANVTAGDSFTVAGDGVMYDVASVDSDTQVTLSVAYAGVTAAGVVYTIARDFTSPDSFPELTTGDIETPTIITRALRKIQSRFTAILAGGSDANFTAMPQVGGSLLVEPATTSKTGTVEKATTTEAKEGTADKFPDAAGVHAAFNQYGLGESASSLIDADDMVTPGTFGGPGVSGVNFPGATKYGFLRVSGRPSSGLSQEAMFGGDEYYMRYTDADDATWTNWEQIYHTGMTPNFPDMPQVGGDPIVESGSNADGQWTRWADGTQICTGNYGSGIGATTFTLTFPNTFINTEYSITGDCGYVSDDFGQLVKVSSPSTSAIVAGWAYGRTLFTDANYTRWAINGRWK